MKNKKNNENKKKSDKVPVKEAVKLTFRGYKIICDKYPMILVSSAVCAVVNSLTPYVGIYFSAQIINEIAGARDISALKRLVIAALISAALLSLLNAGLSRWKNCQHAGQWYKRNKINTDKLLSMDFCDVDDPNTHDLLSQIKQNNQWSGWGIARLFWGFESFISSLFTIAGAVALTESLFTLRVPESAGEIVVLNNPIFIAVIISVMLAVTFISPLLSNKTGIYWARHSENAKMGNR